MTAERSRPADGRGDGDPDLDDVRAAQLDRSAFAALYRRYVGRVYGYAFYMLGDHHDAEDATERAFLAALAAIERFRLDRGTFRSWLFRIAHNELVNALRRRRRHRLAPLDEAASHEASAWAADPGHLVGAEEDARRVRLAVAALSADRRQVLVLRFVDGLTAREIGVVLGRSEGAVRVLQHRALRDVAELLGRPT